MSAPLKTSFVWKVLFLEDIIKQKKLQFSEVKKKIKSAYLNDLINEKIYEKANVFLQNLQFRFFYQKLFTVLIFFLVLHTLQYSYYIHLKYHHQLK